MLNQIEKDYLKELLEQNWRIIICNCEGFPNQRQEDEIELMEDIKKKLSDDEE